MESLVEKIIASEKIAEIAFCARNKIYTFLNPVSYLDADKNRSLFDKVDGIFVDGSIMVKAVKMLYGKNVTRRAFDMTSMARNLFEFASMNGKSVYIVASSQDEINKTIRKIRKWYPSLDIIGYRSGYFMNESDYNSTIANIVNLNPHFLIAGLGAIKQERFLVDVKAAGYEGIGFTCGAFITQTSKKALGMDYFPQWVNKYNLRFVYRMIKEPHTRKRYIKAGILFPLRFVINKIS